MSESEEAAAEPQEEAQEQSSQERIDSALDKAIDEFADKMGWEDAGKSTPEESAAKVAKALEAPDEEEEEGEPEGDEDEDADEAAEPEASGEEEEEADGEQKGAEAEKETEEEDGTDLERALSALRLAGVPSDVIENTGRAKLIAWGLKVAERESKRAADFEAKLKAREPAPEVETTKSAPAQAAALDLAPAMQTIADELGVEPESATKAFTPIVEAILKQVRGEHEERLSKIEQGVASSQAAAGRQIISSNVERLAAVYPTLRSDSKLQHKLIEKAHALSRATGPNGEKLYGSADEVFDDAAKITLGAPKRGDLAQKRRNGVSTPPGIRGSSTAPKTWEEAMDRKLELIEAGRTDLAKRVPLPPMIPKQKKRAGK